jgi:hypothetical protein
MAFVSLDPVHLLCFETLIPTRLGYVRFQETVDEGSVLSRIGLPYLSTATLYIRLLLYKYNLFSGVPRALHVLRPLTD